MNSEKVKSESNEEEEGNLQDVQGRSEDSNLRPMYALFVLPLVVVFTAIGIAYLKQCLQARILNLIRLVDDYITPSDDYDPDQTPAKVLEMLNAMDTDDGEVTSDLLWDDSIERNAQLLVDDISNAAKRNSGIQDEGQLNESSIINVNFDDFLNLFQNQEHSEDQISFPEAADQPPIGSSTPLNLNVKSKSESSKSIHSGVDSRSVDSLAKYINTPEHFPSFTAEVIIDNSDFSEDESEPHYSQTRSGKIYKNL